MRVEHTARIRRSLKRFPSEVQEIFYKQVALLTRDIRHPSLRAKKYDETHGIWQARVNNSVRFYFFIMGDAYLLLNIEKHSD